MTNTQRIWIVYAFHLVAISAWLAVSGFAMVQMETAAGATKTVLKFVPVAAAAPILGAWFFVSQRFGHCWHCDAHLFRTESGWFAPVVLWSRCPNCDVRHTRRPHKRDHERSP